MYIKYILISTFRFFKVFNIIFINSFFHFLFQLGVEDISEVVRQKQGLAFVAYPEAVSLLPWPHVWAFLFFVMLFTLGLDSEFALLETVNGDN